MYIYIYIHTYIYMYSIVIMLHIYIYMYMHIYVYYKPAARRLPRGLGDPSPEYHSVLFSITSRDHDYD